MRTRRELLGGIGVAAITGVTGCSGDDSGSTTPSSNDPTTGNNSETSTSTETETLTLTVGTKPTEDILKRVLGCPDSLGIAHYVATIILDMDLPQTVSVTEVPVPSGEPQTTTFERTQ